MLENKRVVAVTPAGRRRYLELLVPQIQKMRGLIDEYHLWVNTTDVDDIAYMESLASADPDFITLDRLPPGKAVSGNTSIYNFFTKCQDVDTVYIRFDDDIVMLDSEDNIRELLRYRINNRAPFLVYAMVLNNAVCSHLLQTRGKLSTEGGVSGYLCSDPLGWEDPQFAERVHRQVLAAKDLSQFHIDEAHWLSQYERVSINCISWLGLDFAAFGGRVGEEEEQWLSVDQPRALQRPNVIFDKCAVVHYAYYTQRDYLETTDVLRQYSERVTL